MVAFTHLRVLLMSLLIIQTVGSPIIFKGIENKPSSENQGVDQLSDDKHSIKNNEEKGHPKDELGSTHHCAFSANLTHSYSDLTPGSTIVFDAVTLNDGEMYDSTTGKVKIPIDGVYSLSFFILARTQGHFQVILTLDGLQAFDDMGGNVAIFKAFKDQIVTIQYNGTGGFFVRGCTT